MSNEPEKPSEEPEKPGLNPEEKAELALMGVIATQSALGEWHLWKGHWAKAAAAFRRALAVTAVQRDITSFSLAEEIGMSDAAPRSRAFYKLGLALEQLPDLPKATEALEQAVAANPGHIPARMVLARVAAGSFDYDRAIREYEDAYNFVEENRDNYSKAEADKVVCDILTRHGSLLIDMDRPIEAEVILGRAISIYPDNPYSFANYAIVVGMKGDKNRLRKYLGMALDKVSRTVNDNLISDLLQEASNLHYGDAILDMLGARRLITEEVFTKRREAWLRRWEELHKGSGSIHVHND